MLFQLAQSDTKIEMGRRAVGIGFQRLVDKRDGLRVIFCLSRDDTRQMQGIKVPGLKPEHPLIYRRGFDQMPFLMKGHRLVQEGFDPRRVGGFQRTFGRRIHESDL